MPTLYPSIGNLSCGVCPEVLGEKCVPLRWTISYDTPYVQALANGASDIEDSKKLAKLVSSCSSHALVHEGKPEEEWMCARKNSVGMDAGQCAGLCVG